MTATPAAAERSSASAARLRRIAVSAAWRARSLAYLDVARDHRASTLLVGSGRSGTTWVGEVIDRHHDHRVIFEPLRPSHVPQVRAFAHGQYLRPDDADPRFIEPMRAILTGRLRNPWADHLNHAVIARRRLIKEIRANLLLGWLVRQFPGAPIVLLVRHPLAVAASRRHLGWADRLDDALDQPDLVADHLADLESRLRGLRSPIARHVAQWCVHTAVPLRTTAPGEVCLVTYERLVTRRREEFERILRHIGQQPDAALDEALDRPSRLARPGSAVRTGADRTAAWRRHLDAADLAAAAEVLGWFGLDAVYRADRDEPDADALAALHGA